jgi:hypothetical protein
MPFMIITDHDWNDLVATVKRIDTNIASMAAQVDDRFNALSAQMEAKMSEIEDALGELETQATANTNAEAAAVGLIQQLADMIHASAGDPARVRALASNLKTSADTLGAAIVAGTPAGEPPAPGPV